MSADEFLDTAISDPEDGVGLALSGGGYRAMVFHTGALIRINEVALLRKIDRISSVSGGSIIAGILATRWSKLIFEDDVATNFDIVVESVRKMADTTIDAGAIIGGLLLPGSISDRVSRAYDEILFEGATLQSFPDDTHTGNPRFVINATNIQTAALWRFSRSYMGDYRIGLVEKPDVSVASAVAASSAFPPVLSPAPLKIRQPMRNVAGADLYREPFTKTATLSDGGVYDNLGIETIGKRYKTLLVSDAGQKIAPEESPHTDWARHAIRVLDIVDNQVRSLRKRHLVDSFIRGDRNGGYWGIRSDFKDYNLAEDPLNCRSRNPKSLAATPTRLEAMDRDLQDRLMNWGYAVCDAALRAHVGPLLQTKLGIVIRPPTRFPFSVEY